MRESAVLAKERELSEREIAVAEKHGKIIQLVNSLQ